MESAIHRPEKDEKLSMSKVPFIFPDPENIFFFGVNSTNKIQGVDAGDVLIISKTDPSKDGEMMLFLDTFENRFVLSRKVNPLHKYRGIVKWILKKP